MNSGLRDEQQSYKTINKIPTRNIWSFRSKSVDKCHYLIKYGVLKRASEDAPTQPAYVTSFN